jgi:long-chain acyl-CoA synthetase
MEPFMEKEKPWLGNYDPGVPQTLTYPDIPLFRFLDDAADRFPDHPCTNYKDQIIRYDEMVHLSDRLAAFLLAQGLQPGDRVALWLPNCPQFVIAFYGSLKAGGVVSALNPLYKQQELSFQLRDSGARFIICLEEYIGLVKLVLPQSRIQKIITTQLAEASQFPGIIQENGIPERRTAASSPEAYRLLDALREGSASVQPQIQVSSKDPAILQYSGGTTGTPKGAVGLHRNLVANTVQFRTWLVGLEPGKEVVLAAIPLYHVYGMVIAMSIGIALGGMLVLIDNGRNTEEILQNIQRYQATLFPGVPNMYHAINQHPDVLAGKYNLFSIKACISGSAPLLSAIKNKFEQLTGGKLIEGYGLSEAPTATHCNPVRGENRIGSIGLPLPDVDCRIVDPETGGKDLNVRQAGELLIRGPQVMQGYHNMPEETAIALQGGWLHTGDIGWMDEEGFFYLVDRKKDVIKIGGF